MIQVPELESLWRKLPGSDVTLWPDSDVTVTKRHKDWLCHVTHLWAWQTCDTGDTREVWWPGVTKGEGEVSISQSEVSTGPGWPIRGRGVSWVARMQWADAMGWLRLAPGQRLRVPGGPGLASGLPSSPSSSVSLCQVSPVSPWWPVTRLTGPGLSPVTSRRRFIYKKIHSYIVSDTILSMSIIANYRQFNVKFVLAVNNEFFFNFLKCLIIWQFEYFSLIVWATDTSVHLRKTNRMWAEYDLRMVRRWEMMDGKLILWILNSLPCHQQWWHN